MGVRYVINQRGRPQVHNDGQFPDLLLCKTKCNLRSRLFAISQTLLYLL